jgi:hypothetical protein
MESVAAIFSVVARKHFGVFEDPVCENASIFRRLSQGCFVVESEPDNEKAPENKIQARNAQTLTRARARCRRN